MAKLNENVFSSGGICSCQGVVLLSPPSLRFRVCSGIPTLPSCWLPEATTSELHFQFQFVQSHYECLYPPDMFICTTAKVQRSVMCSLSYM